MVETLLFSEINVIKLNFWIIVLESYWLFDIYNIVVYYFACYYISAIRVCKHDDQNPIILFPVKAVI